MSVAENLQAISSARYGRDVRQAICDSISEINDVAVKAEGNATTAQDSAKTYSEAAQQAVQQAEIQRQEAQQAAQQAISSTPEGYADLVAKADSLKSATGDAIILDGTAEGGCILKKMYGVSEQNSVPTPTSPVEIKDTEIKLVNMGKNLAYFPCSAQDIGDYPFKWTSKSGITFTANEDGTFILNGTATAEAAINIVDPYHYDMAQPLVKGRTYYITDGREGQGRHPNGYIQFVLCKGDTENDRKWIKNTIDTGKATYSHTEETLAAYDKWGIRIVVSNGQTCNNVVIKPMVSYVDDSEYEIGKARHELATSIKLTGFEVSSSDNYNLIKNGKYYIADKLAETDEGYEIVRRYGKIVLDGSSDEVWTTPDTINDTEKRRKVYVDSKIPSYTDLGVANWTKGCVKSSHYKDTITSSEQPANRKQSVGLHLSNHWIQVFDERYTENDTTAWREHLAEEPLTVYYRLAKPVREKISASDAKALYSLLSHDTNTSIVQTSEIKGVMEVEYPTSKATGYAIEGYMKAQANKAKIEEVERALLEVMSV